MGREDTMKGVFYLFGIVTIQALPIQPLGMVGLRGGFPLGSVQARDFFIVLNNRGRP